MWKKYCFVAALLLQTLPAPLFGECDEIDHCNAANRPSVGVQVVRGRLGNHLFGYLQVRERIVKMAILGLIASLRR